MFNRTTRGSSPARFGGGLAAAEGPRQVYVNPVYRIRGDALLLANAPAAGRPSPSNTCRRTGARPLTVRRRAIGCWIQTSAGLTKLMTLGLVWRFRQVKGLSYGEDLALYERRVTDAMMRDGTKPASRRTTTADQVPRAPQMPETLIYPP